MKTKQRRKTTRIYRVDENRSVEIQKQWSMKYSQNVYRIANYPDNGHTIAIVPTFAKAKQMISKLLPVLALLVLVNPNHLARDLGLDDLVDIEDRRGSDPDPPASKSDARASRIRDMIRCSRTPDCAFFGTTFEEQDK